MLTEFEPHIAEWVLIPSDAGRFEFEINGELVFSKFAKKRHAEVDEIRQLVQQAVDDSLK
jgi:predicted Rdx family selenoprotein